ncbi:ABC transporter permease [Vermiculatibacterium agrestimuris]|jgi:AI-2 transport system permease protein|uniref:ABC transporter permease n=1 Tax=Vermiculatibacterium agrestimuris TaxID=2941519 RepID=UPI00203AE8E3|nr:ABC transporter permease [Vermiculatibacterium agrestimuris]
MSKPNTSQNGQPSALRQLTKGPNLKWNLVLVCLLAAEFLIFGLANPKFLSLNRIFIAATGDLPIWYISLFVTFVMITGGIDIQSCAIVGFTSIIIGVGWQGFGMNIWAAALLGVVIATLCGALSGFFVAYCGVQAMVVTLGGSFLYGGLALLVSTLSGTAAYNGISGFPDSFKNLSKTSVGPVPLPIIIFLLMLVCAYILLHRSKYGRKVFLVGVNPQAAEYSGISSRAVTMSTYVLSGLAAGITGVVMTSQLGIAKSDLGGNFTMMIITACVLGGTLSTGGKGSVIGTALAAIAITLVRFGMPLCFNINKQYLDIPIGVLLVVVVVGRALANNPTVIAKIGKLREGRKKDAAGVR